MKVKLQQKPRVVKMLTTWKETCFTYTSVVLFWQKGWLPTFCKVHRWEPIVASTLKIVAYYLLNLSVFTLSLLGNLRHSARVCETSTVILPFMS